MKRGRCTAEGRCVALTRRALKSGEVLASNLSSAADVAAPLRVNGTSRRHNRPSERQSNAPVRRAGIRHWPAGFSCRSHAISAS